MVRPKGNPPKEEKARQIVESCLKENSDDFLEKTCELMGKYQLTELVQALRLLARPPPGEIKRAFCWSMITLVMFYNSLV